MLTIYTISFLSLYKKKTKYCSKRIKIYCDVSVRALVIPHWHLHPTHVFCYLVYHWFFKMIQRKPIKSIETHIFWVNFSKSEIGMLKHETWNLEYLWCIQLLDVFRNKSTHISARNHCIDQFGFSKSIAFQWKL